MSFSRSKHQHSIQIERLSAEQAKKLESFNDWVKKINRIWVLANNEPENPRWIDVCFVGTCLAAAKALNGEKSESEHKK